MQIDTVDISGKAKRMVHLWNNISKQKPGLTMWAKARVISEKIGCELKKLPLNEYHKDDLHVLGQTNGKTLHVRKFKDSLMEAFTFFHEVGHVVLHYGTENRHRYFSKVQLEKEADEYAMLVCCELWPQYEEKIRQFALENPIYN